MTLVAQLTFLLLLPRQSPSSSPGSEHLLRPPLARYRNGSRVNTKALLSHLVDVMEIVGETVRQAVQPRADADVLETEESGQLLDQLSMRMTATIRQSLLPVVSLDNMVHFSTSEVDEVTVQPIPLSKNYRDDVHQIVWFDQWLDVDDLTVWITELDDSRDLITSYKLKVVTLSVCVSVAGRPHLTVIVYPFRNQQLPPPSSPSASPRPPRLSTLHWGLAERGNDMQLRVSGAHRFLPERYGLVMDGHAETARLARAAFGADTDLYYSGTISHQLLSVLSLYADLALYSQPLPMAALCPVHTLMDMYGGKVTDFKGRTVVYDRHVDGGRVVGGVLSALYYHRPLLQMLTNSTK